MTSLAITPGTDFVKINATESYTATATYSDGTTQAVQAVATIYADFEGRRGTLSLRIVPDYEGRWVGDWNVTGCSGEGDWLEICDEFRPGELFALAFVFTQNRDAITGTTDFGDDLPGPVKGTIRMDGVLVINATYVIFVEGMPLELTLTDWETTTTDNQRLTGHMCVVGRVVGLQGSFEIDGELRVVTKMPSPAAGMDRASGRRGLLAAIRGR